MTSKCRDQKCIYALKKKKNSLLRIGQNTLLHFFSLTSVRTYPPRGQNGQMPLFEKKYAVLYH